MNKDQQEGLRKASQIAAKTLKTALDNTKIGMSLDDVDEIVHESILSMGAYPSAIDYMHFPKSVCTSVNEVVAHGIPNDYVLKDGDYLNIDVVCYFDGHHGDNSGMVMLGNVHPDIQKLSQVTRESMYAAIEIVKPGATFDQIGKTIEEYADKYGYAVNAEFGGHGIAHHMHMPPMVYHNKTRSSSKQVMKPGMAFTIEPILMMKKNFNYVQWRDNWTISTNGVPSCQWEHIILVTEEGHEILTIREGETNPLDAKRAAGQL
ncbi:methionine aminopeptidase [Stylonychia lemnae]|uniref:Methionine aminopeptidase n=1 Tax=Stylonychia lemnae TaxID=5949 RepID=A0A078A5U6_STYLE|nr:methionine aminopeptidase [Stylonychia lemnae]|eukprot:CDW77276.1 methionine aminopeptidase [Stylonychia lemnae]